ncbi:N-acetylglucosamine kinase [candidate division KSB1 bacterium]
MKKKFRKLLDKYISSLLSGKRIKNSDVKFLVCGFAGVGRESDRSEVRTILDDLGFKDRSTVNTDIEIAFNGAFPEGEGIVLNAGTGSIALGRDKHGNFIRCGGWGFLIGDEGSAYYMGREAIRYAFHSYDGRKPETILLDKFCEVFSLSSFDEIIPKIYDGSISNTEIAGLAPLVIKAYEKNDRIGQIIIAHTVTHFAAMVNTVKNKMNRSNERVDLCLSGGLFKNKILRKKVFEELIDEVNIVKKAFDPVIGAVIFALNKSGISMTDEIKQNLVKIQF